MTHPIEILIHISGPSRGTDDARYRREALGLLNFEPVERHELQGSEESGDRNDGKEHIIIRGSLKAQRAEPGQTQSNIRNSWTQHDHTPHMHRSGRADKPSKALPNAINTPLPQLMTPSITRPTPNSAIQRTTIKETPHLLIARTPALPRPRTAPTQPSNTHATPSLRRTQSDSWQTPPSVIPDSQPMPPSTSLPEISSSPILKRPYLLSSSPSPTRPPDSPLRKRARLQMVSSPPSELHGAAAAADKAPTSEEAPTSSAVDPDSTSSSPPALKPNSLEIHPPHPKTSDAHFKTHLTPSLRTLSTKLLKYYKPHTTTRPLINVERGHWFVRLSTFDSTLLTKFWDFLGKFVGQGQAGFGTRCFREMVDVGNGKETGSDKENHTPGQQEEIAKIYCFGEVVGEIWIVLFLATERRIKGVGAKWIDAAGEAVVIMN
ncbi:hypothetical protein OEA41_006022 [Lepraria neglecta]|uniref:Uncharacterized protein n=1 Tax=Lepraria neglecta TaxID=209136 RepID=A0AAD9Z894_9LECA|nr:hypothetical protein OEA41_006022 [Lepraria neglecta]